MIKRNRLGWGDTVKTCDAITAYKWHTGGDAGINGYYGNVMFKNNHKPKLPCLRGGV